MDITNLDQLPTISAIYRVWHGDHVVYVGQAKNLKQRWKSHHILPKLIQRYQIDWWIDWVKVAPENLDRAEALAYRTFKPKLNQINPCHGVGDPTATLSGIHLIRRQSKI
jgi:GIY-YIG catalytic domain